MCRAVLFPDNMIKDILKFRVKHLFLSSYFGQSFVDITINYVILEFELDDIVAQCLIFIFGGFNAIPLSQGFMAHELVMNQDIQQKLYTEVKEVHNKLGDKPITYEILQGMKYMDVSNVKTNCPRKMYKQFTY